MNKENQKIEYKEIWKDEWLKWICAFANSGGGKIYIGIDDDGKVIGVKDINEKMKEIPNKISDTMTIICEVNQIKKHNKDIIEIIVDSYDNLISYKGKYYKRSGATNREISGEELHKILNKQKNISWCDVGVVGAKITDIDNESIRIFKEQAIASGRMKSTDLKCSNKLLLDKLNLIDIKGNITRAGVLLFNTNPQKFFLNSHIKIGYFENNDADLKFQDEVYGSLIRQVDTTMDLIFTKYLKGLIYYKGTHRIEQYPVDRDGLREILINAIIHKDYVEQNPIQISVYKDKIYIFNMGHFPKKLSNENALYKKHASFPFNPTIANVFYKAGFIEGWGRGFEKILDGVKSYPGKRPTYDIDDDSVMVCYKACEKYVNLLRNDKGVTQGVTQDVTQGVTQDKMDIEIINMIKNDNKITIDKIAKDLKLSRRTIIRHIKSIKELKYAGSGYSGHWEIIK